MRISERIALVSVRAELSVPGDADVRARLGRCTVQERQQTALAFKSSRAAYYAESARRLRGKAAADTVVGAYASSGAASRSSTLRPMLRQHKQTP
jgi:hypothetical protein